MPDDATETLPRLLAQRSQIVQQMTRIKNRIHVVLHTKLIPPYDGELFSASGRVWLGSFHLDLDEMLPFWLYIAELDQSTLRAIVRVESGGHAFAINVNGAPSEPPPAATAAEATAETQT
jgi:transposase